MSEYIKEKYFKKASEGSSINAKLDSIDSSLGIIDGKPTPLVERIFVSLDEIFDQAKELKSNEFEKLQLESQLNYLSKQIYRNAKTLLRAFGGKDKLITERKKRDIPSDHWWWFLDHHLEEKRKRNIKQILKGGLIVISVFAFITIIYYQFFAPPPEVRARIRLEGNIDDLIDLGDYDTAMQEIIPAIELTPDYFPLWIKKGVLAKVLGDEQTEYESYGQARELSNDLVLFYMERANVFMQFGLLDDVLADAENLQEINSDSAEAYLFQGLVFETRGEGEKALKFFERALELAELQGDGQLAATIKVRMGMMMPLVPMLTPYP